MKFLKKPNRRITHLIRDARRQSGGAQTILHQIHEHQQRNFYSRIISFTKNTSPQTNSGIFFITIKTLATLILNKHDIYIIHDRILLIPFLFIRNRKAIFVCHSTFPDKNYIFRFSSHLRFIAVSEASFLFLKSVNPKILPRLIPNGIPTPPKEEMRRKAPSTEINLGYVGRLSEEKGILDLINAFSKVAFSNQTVKLHLVGEGPLREFIETSISASNLSERIILHGHHPFPFSVLQNINALVVPSHYEGFGLVYYEALARNHVVIASHLPSFKVLPKEKKVFFFPAGDTLQLETLINRFIEDSIKIDTIESISPRHTYSSATKMASKYYDFIGEIENA
ncbi:glycosyltransferase family 4 protein [Halopseudomonas maritima]|uniref:glycosyltransferase family 4 protein n=1 Tax=Halopseudomonas maritima TaxID=2918528 RepID=UPI001EEBFC7A|nr:glycosyltransferase family 4 protein [Halopseudomonas maritima]UJJ32053.1 glycosyltransferase family 4 protein [Halopseudomonas maritima]